MVGVYEYEFIEYLYMYVWLVLMRFKCFGNKSVLKCYDCIIKKYCVFFLYLILILFFDIEIKYFFKIK